MSTVRLRPGVHYAPIEGGVYFSSARATFVMGGPAVLFRVVDTCVPLLEDGSDIERLVAAIGTPAAAPLVTHLVDTLDSRGLLLALDDLLVPEPSPQERLRFPETLAYLESYQDQPYADFRRVRAACVLLAGPAEALGPAARGLVRAGAGQIVVVTPEPKHLTALAERHPEVRVIQGGSGAMAGCSPQAAVIFTEDAFPAEAIGGLPAGCLVVVARLGKDLAIVGPVAQAATGGVGVERLWSRATEWCRRDGDEALLRPSSDLLAGALAAQAAFDALVGLNPGRAHVVHGPDLSADSITPALAPQATYDAPTVFPPASTAPAEEGAPSVDWRDAVSARWSGLFRLVAPGDVAQMPLAVTVAEGRSRGFDGRVVGFGPDQEASTTEAALAGLRRYCNESGRTGSDSGSYSGSGSGSGSGSDEVGESVPAAGLDETEWLLDGALRLLARFPGRESTVDWLAVDNIEARRLWRTLEEYELVPARLSASQVDGFGWALVSVRDRRNDALLARGWGPTPAAGAAAALSAAVATRQVRRSAESGSALGEVSPGLIHHLHQPHLPALAASVQEWLTANRRHLRGRRLAADAVAGPIGAWCGAVWLSA